MNRRAFLFSSWPATLAAASEFEVEGLSQRVCLVSGAGKEKLDVAEIFDELRIDYQSFSAAEAEAADPRSFSLLWIACPVYPFHNRLPDRLVASIESFLNAGAGVFAEFVVNFPGIPALPTPQKTGSARLFLAKALGTRPGSLPGGSILDEHDSVCLPLAAEASAWQAVLNFGNVSGVQRVMETPPAERVWPGLVMGERGRGRFALATTSVSQFRRREYAPIVHWRRFLCDLVLALLPADQRQSVLSAYLPLDVHTEPRSWVPPQSPLMLVIQTRPEADIRVDGTYMAAKAGPGGRVEIPLKTGAPGMMAIAGSCSAAGTRRTFRSSVLVADRKDAYLRALRRNIEWFEGSGVLLRADGTQGVAEWMSGPDINGNRIPYGKGQMFSPERADCVFESGVAFCLYAKAADSARHLEIGKNLLMSVLDLQRLERKDPRYGLWYTRGRSGPPYQDDIAMATIGCFEGHRYTAEPALYDRGVLSAKASLDAFRRGGRNGLALAGATDDGYGHPHDRGQLIASWLYAYGATEDDNYLHAALPLLTDMIERFDAIPIFLISRTEEAARFLLPLALAFFYTGDTLFSRELKKRAEYLVSRMAPCGAVQEEGSNARAKGGATDVGLTFDSSETISDQLYTTSFAAMNLWVAYKATAAPFYLEAFEKLMDYLVRIQIEDRSKPAIDGGWMRGFDYSLWEYYGSNADESWTPYCLETGWCNAIIDTALGLYLSGDPFFSRQSGRRLAVMSRTGVNGFPEKSRCTLPHGAAVLALCLVANAGEPVHLRPSSGEVEVLIGGRSFTTFYFSKKTAKPYLMPLRSPSGIVVTRNFPVVNDVSGADLRSPSFEPHQRPLYFAHGNIDGLDFWSEEVFDPLFNDRGAQSCGHMRLKRMQRLSEEPGRATVEARFLLLDPSEREMAEETQSYTFNGDARTRTIDCEYRIYATAGPVVIGDSKEGTFAIRLAPELSAPRDHMLDSEGRHGEKEIWGKRANWVSYSGTIGGMLVGIAVFDSPASFRHPTTWMARAYGLFAANPFGLRAFTRDNSQDGSWTIPEGQSLRFRYRVLIFDGELTRRELAERYNAYAAGE